MNLMTYKCVLPPQQWPEWMGLCPVAQLPLRVDPLHRSQRFHHVLASTGGGALRVLFESRGCLEGCMDGSLARFVSNVLNCLQSRSAVTENW